MWDDYIKIDNRIIRPLDGFEFILTSGFLYVTDFFDFFEIGNFKNKCNEILPKIEPFNYAIKNINILKLVIKGFNQKIILTEKIQL